MNRLLTLFKSIQPISEEEQKFMSNFLFLESFKKGDNYCDKDKVCKKIGFVLEGVFRVVKIDEKGNEHIPYFTSEGHFAVAIESFTNKTTSDEYIEALTDCTVITITAEAYDLFEVKVLNFSKIINTLKEKAFIEKHKLKSEMLMDNAEMRYHKLVARNPTIIQRIAQNHIALYLGITPFTLSRIRSKK
ncbi:Crp/Fnr family transcriptional regulator [Flavobacterium sp.]|uniref:Crp/Fnr family transcriptional regulator n=1 Tax=Flavobacterium sp. TaxID=239 RepID=UPI003C357DC1